MVQRLQPLQAVALAALTAVVLCVTAPPAAAQPQHTQRVIDELNSHATVDATEGAKSYKLLFDAYLQMTEPPMTVGDNFNLTTIWPGMENWQEVAAWAETNQQVADAFIKAKEDRTIVVGLPYGQENVPSEYREAGIMVDLTSSGMRDIQFEYFPAVDALAACATAEIYRLFEADNIDRAMTLSESLVYVLRQFADRDFLAEKLHSINLLSDALSNLRDQMYVYQEEIGVDRLVDVAYIEVPFLRPDRSRLLMPEADRLVSEELIKEVFTSRSLDAQADPEKFRDVFGKLQSEDKPLTRFGAALRWQRIAQVHGSLESSLERLRLVYDDWWRRWRVEAYSPILDIRSQFERTNPVRYAAVIYSMANLQELFAVRNRLIVEVNGTAMSAGIASYNQRYGTYPRDDAMLYGQSMRRQTNIDPYDRDYGPFKYTRLTSRHAIDTDWGRLWLESESAMLWSVGQDHSDDRVEQHSDDGLVGDILIWPPVKAVAREQDLLE